LRRRVSPLGQQALRLAWGMPETAEAQLIFASRHGEFARTLSILEQVVDGAGASPADFTLSVHHALAGLLSIAKGNRGGHAAVAAGDETLPCGLLEAALAANEHPSSPVVLVYYDEPLPSPYDELADPEQETMALVITLSSAGPGTAIRLTAHPAGDAPCPLTRPGETFLAFLIDDEIQTATMAGLRQTWRLEKIGAPAP
jgi:hypothetical protein